MAKGKLNIFERVRYWNPIDENLLLCILTALTFVCCYWYFTRSYRQIDLNAFTEEVELVSFDFQKSYSLSDFYSTKQKLDKIVFDLEYIHKQTKYESKAVVYWEYVTPKFERILDKMEIEKLIIKCKKESPEKAMVLVKNE